MTVTQRPTVLISSTVVDFPHHRDAVRDACLRADCFPLRMEELSADSEDALRVSTELVGKADIFVGVLGFRYGTIPPGGEMSIQETEYREAQRRQIPILMFLMDEEHLLTVADVEKGEAHERISRLREEIEMVHVVAYFQSPEELRSLVFQALRETAASARSTSGNYWLPTAPAAYIAHPYTLLQTTDVIGRRAELNLLTDWVTGPPLTPIMCVVSIGGMGKTALAWKWFNDRAALERPDLQGRFWWSFYEHDSGFDQFLVHGLSYATGMAIDAVRNIRPSERCERLLRILDRRPFLFVLDGLERLLTAYSVDPDSMRESTSAATEISEPCNSIGLITHAGSSLSRRTASAEVGAFLRRLRLLDESCILATSRLIPAELEAITGDPLSGVFVYELGGLSTDDALELWRAHGVSGSRAELLDFLRAVDNYPLAIRALAGEVARFRDAPGDFTQWRSTHPEFHPFGLDLTMARSHVLKVALDGLSVQEYKVLRAVSAFRMPVTFKILESLVVGAGKALDSEVALDATLTGLEDRGLISWNKTQNRYDQHPVVRGIVWRETAPGEQTRTLESIAENLSRYPPEDSVQSTSDLALSIDLYRSLLALRRYTEAYEVLSRRLIKPAVEHDLWSGQSEWCSWFVEQPAALKVLSGDEAWHLCYQFAGVERTLGRADRAWRLLEPTVDVRSNSDQPHDFEDPAWGRSIRGLHLAQIALGDMGCNRKSDQLICDHLELIRYMYGGDYLVNLKRDGLVNDILHTLGNFALYVCQPVAAEDLLAATIDLLTELPAEADVRNWQGVCYRTLAAGALDMERANRAREWLRLSFAFPSGVEGRLHASELLGELGLLTGHLDEATRQLERAVHMAREYGTLLWEASGLYTLARVYIRLNQLERAQDLLTEAHEKANSAGLQPHLTYIYHALAELSESGGRRSEALKLAQAAYEYARGEGAPYCNTNALLRSERFILSLGGPDLSIATRSLITDTPKCLVLAKRMQLIKTGTADHHLQSRLRRMQ